MNQLGQFEKNLLTELLVGLPALNGDQNPGDLRGFLRNRRPRHAR
jgi:hypothetical protein